MKKKSHKKTILGSIMNNRKLAIVTLIVLFIAFYCIYKVIGLIQNPADTFSVEQGKIYQEESSIRLYN